MNILLVEDEIKVASFLENALKSEGHSVYSVHNLQDAILQVESPLRQWDLAILDRMLQRDDAAQLLPLIKKHKPQTKIFVLSTISSPQEKARLINQGADEYMSKPFSLEELSARIHLVHRRNQVLQPLDQLKIEIGDLQIDRIQHSVHILNKKLELTGKEYQLLLLLAEKKGRVFSKYQLLDLIWNTQFEIESNVVEVTIKNIRKKLTEAGSSVQIESRRNVGYWLEE